jgi:phosphatidylserine/phosphatidylglycerophosphate/cardiolipin synthase-like enzyme
MKCAGAVLASAILLALFSFSACLNEEAGNNCPDASVVTPQMQVYFSPQGGIHEELINLMDDANATLDIAVYLITSQELASSVISAHDRGVLVRMVVDAGACEDISYSQCDSLQAAGVEIRRRMASGLMHNKFLIVDSKIVGTGSANWSTSAEENNNENLLVVESPDLARIYSEEFSDLFGN